MLFIHDILTLSVKDFKASDVPPHCKGFKHDGASCSAKSGLLQQNSSCSQHLGMFVVSLSLCSDQVEQGRAGTTCGTLVRKAQGLLLVCEIRPLHV